METLFKSIIDHFHDIYIINDDYKNLIGILNIFKDQGLDVTLLIE